jgi:UDP-glucose 4-epimerase
MHAWVTGATGFVGSALVARLRSRGARVTALVRPASRGHAPAGVEIIEGSLPDVSGLARAARPDVVFHCAAAIDCEEREGRALHVDGTLALAELTPGARFVHVSTSHVYGDRQRRQALTEASACAPTDAYGRTKLEGERRLLELRRGAVVLRPPGIYGPGATRDVISNMARKIARSRFYHVGDGRALRSWLFVETLVDAMLHLAENRAAHGVFLIDDGRPVSRRELAGAIAAELGRPARFLELPIPLALAAGFCAERMLPPLGIAPPITTAGVRFRSSAHALDTARLKSTGFVHRFTLRDALRATLEPSRPRRP